MPRRQQPKGSKGSLRWIQTLVNDYPEVLGAALNCGSLIWRSPLARDDFAEYWDQSFLDLLNVGKLTRSLPSFWPRSGPRWDAFGRNDDGALVLVEAKAHIKETTTMCSARPRSREKIAQAFNEVAAAWGVSVTPAWISMHYQYANRLAHAFFLQELNARPTILVFLHIIGDSQMSGPSSRAAWETSIAEVHKRLGLRKRLPGYIRDAFVDVSSGVPIAV
jgi:hypothetical protein